LKPRSLIAESTTIPSAAVLTLILAIPIALALAPLWSDDSPWVFTLLFALIGFLMIAVLLEAWYMALFGGDAVISMTDLDVPIGVEVQADVRLSRSIMSLAIKRVRVDIRIDSDDAEVVWKTVWKQRFPVQMCTPKNGLLRFALPSDIPQSNNSRSSARFTLTLHASLRSWSFQLSTRAALPYEIGFGLKDSTQLGNLHSNVSDEQVKRNRKKLLIGGGLFVVVITVLQIAWSMWKP
jgi:hypothetical protein